MSNMLGAGPFITISTLMSAMGGPQALLGWVIALLISLPDGMVWAELGAAMPDREARSVTCGRDLVRGSGTV